MKPKLSNPNPENDEELGKETLAKSGLFCAETVLSAIAREHDIQSPLIPGIATGLCSGMARTCGTCGALTGGILALNLIHGRSSPDESVETNYALVKQLIERFAEQNKTTNCAELLGCDLATEEGQQKFETQNLFEQCKAYTKQSISIVRDLLEHNSASSGPNLDANGEIHG
ncbi:MAG: C_GCAxxG_C_C family protein [Rhodobacteraceae bacterium]|nr:C_GCAxxG_C_C family protein [Paracoccaceae bacterium]